MATRSLLIARLAAGAVAGLALVAAASVFAVSEWRIRRSHEAPLVALRVVSAPDPVAGEHLSRLVGCWSGCHGPEGEGGIEQIAGYRRITAPTLSEVLPHYNDAELVRLIRYGVKRDGRSAFGMIPSVFWSISDQDLADIIAHLRRQPPRRPVMRLRELTLRGRLALTTGEMKVSADQVDRQAPRWGELPRTNAYERGRYLASIVCSECHGQDFRGEPLEGGPSLAVIAAYQPESFREFMRTGKPIGGRDIPKMSWLPEVGLTEREIADLYDFLRRYHGVANEAGS
jgi:cytochrome c553